MGSNILSPQKIKLYEEIREYYKNNEVSKIEVSRIFKINKHTCYDVLKNISNKPKINLNENYFENINSKKKAYWLGFILADGSLYKNRLKICLSSKDRNHILKFKKDIKSNKKIYDFNNTYKLSELHLNSKKLIEDLNDKNVFSNKSTNEIPFYEINDELLPSYILGIYDGDGWLSFNKNSREFGICSSLEICEFVKNKLEKNLEIKSNKIILNNSKINNSLYRYRVTRKKDIITILEYLYSNSDVYLDRKYKKFIDFKTF